MRTNGDDTHARCSSGRQTRRTVFKHQTPGRLQPQSGRSDLKALRIWFEAVAVLRTHNLIEYRGHRKSFHHVVDADTITRRNTTVALPFRAAAKTASTEPKIGLGSLFHQQSMKCGLQLPSPHHIVELGVRARGR